MAVLVPNQFSSYNLTEEETLQGSILTITQQQVMRNHMASIAAERLSHAYDPNDKLGSIQQEAENRAQIDLIMYFLDQSDAAVEATTTNPDTFETK